MSVDKKIASRKLDSWVVKLGLLVLAVFASWYWAREFALYAVQSSAQEIIDRDGIKGIKVTGVAAPKNFLPFIGPEEFESFLFVGDSESNNLSLPECPTVVTYRYKAAGSRYLIEINVKELRECSTAMTTASN